MRDWAEDRHARVKDGEQVSELITSGITVLYAGRQNRDRIVVLTDGFDYAVWSRTDDAKRAIVREPGHFNINALLLDLGEQGDVLLASTMPTTLARLFAYSGGEPAEAPEVTVPGGLVRRQDLPVGTNELLVGEVDRSTIAVANDGQRAIAVEVADEAPARAGAAATAPATTAAQRVVRTVGGRDAVPLAAAVARGFAVSQPRGRPAAVRFVDSFSLSGRPGLVAQDEVSGKVVAAMIDASVLTGGPEEQVPAISVDLGDDPLDGGSWVTGTWLEGKDRLLGYVAVSSRKVAAMEVRIGRTRRTTREHLITVNPTDLARQGVRLDPRPGAVVSGSEADGSVVPPLRGR